MSEICSKCGLPKEICACQAIGKETAQPIHVYTMKTRFNKLVTVIQGIAANEIDRAAKELKHKLACGGSSKEGRITLQGDHCSKVKEALVKLGYPEEIIKMR